MQVASTNQHKTVIVIPARYGSSRLPGKPLMDISGKPMIQHVYERAIEVQNVDKVVVATDDERIQKVVECFGGDCVMTSTEHESGTDRLVEVMEKLPADIYINLQGDEPLVRSASVQKLVDGMQEDAKTSIGTLCHEIDLEDALEPNTVKVVLDNDGFALYFSRSPIPFPRDKQEAKYLKHIGVYGYRQDVLEKYSSLPRPMTEKAEKLEQLRLMAAGYSIKVFPVDAAGPGVDTPECLEKVRSMMQGS